MRKVFSLFIGLLLLSIIPIQAQTRFGVKAGLNLATNAITKDQALEKESYNGFMIGPTMEAMIPMSNFGIDLSVLYSQKGVAFKDFGKATVSYIEIPLNLRYKYTLLGLAGAYAFAGPYVSYGFPGKLTDNIKDIDINKLDVGGNVGFGVQVLKLQVGANYSFGFAKNVLEIQQEGLDPQKIDYKNGLWSITAAYFF